MNRKHLVVGLSVLLVAGIASLIGAYAWGELQEESSLGRMALPNSFLGLTLAGFGKEKQEEPLIREESDFEKLPLPPPAPANVKELKELVDRVAHLDFPECELAQRQESSNCKDPDFVKSFHLCLVRAYYEIERVKQIRDQGMVPELIGVAETRKYRYGSLVKSACDEMRIMFAQGICKMRFNAIYALGEIGDEKAIKPLLELVEEPLPDLDRPSSTEPLDAPCVLLSPAEGDDQLSFTCAEAVKALSKLDLEKAGAKSRQEALAVLDKFEVGSGPESEKDFTQGARVACKLLATTAYGEPALDKLIDNYHQADIPEQKKQVFLRLISEIRDSKAIPRLTELLHGDDPALAKAAAEALAGMASSKLLSEYIWMAENGFEAKACKAFAQLKDPATTESVIKIIQTVKNGYVCTDAIIAIGPDAREAVPVLIEKLSTCSEQGKECRIGGRYAKALGAIGDESAVPALYQFALTSPDGLSGSWAASALGNIPTNASIEALKKLIQGDENRKTPQSDIDRRLVRYDAVMSLWKIQGKEALPFLCSIQDDPKVSQFIRNNYCKDKSN